MFTSFKRNRRRWKTVLVYSIFLFSSFGCSNLAQIFPPGANTPFPTPQEVAPGWKALIVDTFDKPSKTFSDETHDYEDATLAVSTKEGMSVWDFTAKNDYAGIGLNIPEIKSSGESTYSAIGDFYLSMEVRQTRCTSTCEYGVLFRSAGNDMYSFSIQEQKGTFDFSFTASALTRWKDFNRQTPSAAIQSGGWNRIAIKAVGSRISLWINDEPAAQADDSSVLSGRIVFIVMVNEAGGGAEFELDNLLLYTP
jgi:hypothetical protein